MPPTTQFCKFICIVLLFIVTIVRSEDSDLIIPLNKTLTRDNKELFGEFVTIRNNSILHLNLVDVNKNVSYVIIQTHSHIYNISLYKTTPPSNTAHISGTNLGLYGVANSPDIYYVINNNSIDLKLYISVHGYTIMDPIAGGCNMNPPVPILPFMNVIYSKDMVTVDAPAPQITSDTKCSTDIDLTFYRMYITEKDFSEDSYFEGLKNMMTLGKIEENGYEVPPTKFFPKLRRFLGAYPGTGAFYVAVASIDSGAGRYAVYVPIHTYACSPLDGCEILDDYVSQFFCASLIFIGLFSCFLGHRFFITEMFMVGTFAGIIVTYILLSIWTDLERPALLGASFMTGLFFGAIWVLLWWFYGIPVLSVALATMHLGFIFAAIVYHSAPGGNSFFANDGRFWTVFILLMIGCSITLTTVSYLSNILCCAVLGSYLVVFAIDHYVGSSLKYIVYNTVRRAVVPEFKYVVLAMPYQWKDAILTVVWLGLAVGGFLFQHYHNCGRPPFPPPPRSISVTTEPMTYGSIENRGRRRFWKQPNDVDSTVTVADERTPLIENDESD